MKACGQEMGGGEGWNRGGGIPSAARVDDIARPEKGSANKVPPPSSHMTPRSGPLCSAAEASSSGLLRGGKYTAKCFCFFMLGGGGVYNGVPGGLEQGSPTNRSFCTLAYR